MQEEFKPLEEQGLSIPNRLICYMCKKKMKMKRSRSLSPKASSSEEDMKRIKFEEDKRENDIIYPHILDFSDDVLLNIFKFLNPKDLMAISLSCQRLARVAQDMTLWRRVDFRASPILLNDLKEYIRFLQPMTTSLAMRGNLFYENDAELSPCFFNSIKTTCTDLKELIIEEYRINGDKCLILSNCQWFTPHSLLVISKMPKLKELRLNSCHRLGECVAYTSLATRFGFKTLEILDLRDTALGDSEVGCFSCTKTLTHLYLEFPSSSRNTEPPEPEPRPLQRDAFNQLPVYEDENLAQFLVEDGFRWESYMFGRCLITDRVICALGSDTCDRRIINNSAEGVIVVEEDKRIFNKPLLKTLVVRNYPHVTNSSLMHLALNASSLEHLDVSGTSVTRQAVETFKSQRPNVQIITSFD
ncbi:uncharacterized protein LOC143428120 isoform X4 [Xylocopa sonorina]|uniref:uncharacterized protein LOC143428120 isoform X4 n=1 Tax=Xylocopa sonorina TaxID=1818115 RepID=UPI00403B2E6C